MITALHDYDLCIIIIIYNNNNLMLLRYPTYLRTSSFVVFQESHSYLII